MITSNSSRRLRRAIAHHSTKVMLQWVERTGGTVDTTTGQSEGGTAETKELEIRGVWHEITAESRAVHFTHLEVGNVIFDVDDSGLDLASKSNPAFVKDGRVYRQKQMEGKLATHYGGQLGAGKTIRTLFLELAR